MVKSGIYIILNKVNGKFYIGSGQDLKRRWRDHRGRLARNIHCNPHLQGAWNKYGSENFCFTIMEECAVDMLQSREQQWLDLSGCLKHEIGYNLSPTAGSIRGYKRPPFSTEHRARLSDKSKARWADPVERERMERGQRKGKLVHRESYVLAQQTRWKNPEYRAKQVERLKKTKPTQEQIAKSVAKTAKQYTITYTDGRKENIVNLAKFARSIGVSVNSLRTKYEYSPKNRIKHTFLIEKIELTVRPEE